MFSIKEVFLSIKENFDVKKSEIKDLLLISLLLGIGISFTNFNQVDGFVNSIYYLFYHIAIVFITFTFYITGIKVFSSILYYKAKFNVQLIGAFIFFVILWLTNGSLVLGSIIYILIMVIESLIVMRFVEVKNKLLKDFRSNKRKIFAYCFNFSPIIDKRINKEKRSKFSDIGWNYFFGFLFVLILYTIILKSPFYNTGNEYVIANYFILWFIIYNLIPYPPQAGIYILFSGRSRYIFILSLITIYLLLIHFLSTFSVILISILISLLILYFYFHHFEIHY
ncbi:hypothetical protein HOK68_02040 [Candidatus Woesearchaeota archaeon]|jgi:hypothetical protein|nr:hypothetical protein [Candidatus Woesearchaeota archaeon]MBT4387764.1 hypothetical protein [Candidatus Woesearchaeota archaeon]MBT4595583.1 hypothetical protein [Candidatus Woesearchaeota archaeon]MBT5740934.1 hypothetical protein [Candidatus Woesearchaeota archaeon]MBT6505536.1 hypothetical protein [Candidatus Woesearchaeota archaeon]